MALDRGKEGERGRQDLLTGEEKGRGGQYAIVKTNIYKIHNCFDALGFGHQILAGDVARVYIAHHVTVVPGSTAWISVVAIVSVDGVNECLIEFYKGTAGGKTVETSAKVRREKVLKIVNSTSIENSSVLQGLIFVLRSRKDFSGFCEVWKGAQRPEDIWLASLGNTGGDKTNDSENL
ncbi:uncharacterized protein BCR38DRAFT_412764 [Pseudomassariella vexata]|uniref:Uncharacterized protein n=1 Tax=Pseudomassariella vexata TaxID=1141098 RepID=A0A1Y2DKN9_9PEZI|nr:uncharacterized protein BCR38DRAFT_412764 [Pseudomassariella vexata]ORY59771.1 hypothetical protein BCR38DRAFT_412764 [Pseudomassariella vexata]